MDEREKIEAALKQGSKAFSVYSRSELRKALDSGKGRFGTKDTEKTVVDFITDALIAANIGDVTEWKERAEKHRVIALPGGRIKQLYSDEEVEQIVKERDELKERAGSEIKSCYKEIAEKRDETAKLRKQLKRAQNAAKKQKHRAEVAERALDLCETAYILSLNHRVTEGISGQAIASDFGIRNFFMKQAEKELTEEG